WSSNVCSSDLRDQERVSQTIPGSDTQLWPLPVKRPLRTATTSPGGTHLHQNPPIPTRGINPGTRPATTNTRTQRSPRTCQGQAQDQGRSSTPDNNRKQRVRIQHRGKTTNKNR